jgi:Putative lactococcus lactis phage r1t holin
MFTSRFWKLTAERAVKTFAQTLAGVLVVGGATLLSANWPTALSTAGMAAVVSVLTSVGSLKIGPADSPSVVKYDPPAQATPQPAPEPQAVAPVTPVAVSATAA